MNYELKRFSNQVNNFKKRLIQLKKNKKKNMKEKIETEIKLGNAIYKRNEYYEMAKRKRKNMV